jgi:putrescine transport system substrate-binding protein
LFARWSIAGILSVWLALSPAWCDEDKVLNVYNWTDYITEDVLQKFEAEFGIRVRYDTYDTSAIVDAKLLAGRTGYDVIFHDTQLIGRLSPIGVLMPLDRSKLPNWKNLDPVVLDKMAAHDPGNKYAAPYMWGTVGFAYNVDMVLERVPDAPLDSAAMLFDPEIVSRLADCGVTFLDTATDFIPLALQYIGRDGDSLAPEDLAAAEEVIRRVRPYIKYFDSTRMIQDLPSREVCLAGSWSGDYAQAWDRAIASGIDIRLAYTAPKEGSPVWFDALIIPSDAPHPDNAHKFLNFLMRPEIIAEISNFVYYANGNKASVPYLKDEVINNPAIYPPPDANIFSRKIPSPKDERRRTRLWARIKSGL